MAPMSRFFAAGLGLSAAVVATSVLAIDLPRGDPQDVGMSAGGFPAKRRWQANLQCEPGPESIRTSGRACQ